MKKVLAAILSIALSASLAVVLGMALKVAWILFNFGWHLIG